MSTQPAKTAEPTQLEQMMEQLTINVTKLTTLQSTLQAQVTNTETAQKATEAQLTILQNQMKEQAAQLEKMNNSLATISQGERGTVPTASSSTEMIFNGLEEHKEYTDQPITGLQCAQLIQHALTQQVAPVCQHLDHRIDVLEAEMRKLKIRTAWVERDTMWQQVEQAKVTLIARGWPDTFTAEDRQRVITEAMKKCHISPTWQIIHTVQYQAEQGKKSQIAAHTLVKFWSVEDKRRFTDYFQEPGYPTIIPCTDFEEVEDPQNPGQKKWDLVERKERIKLTPSVTQFERRLTAPMHELMNALTTAFPQRFKGQTLKPYWKTMVIVDPSTEAWIGQLQYVRARNSSSLTTGSPTDWNCHILLPEEIYEPVMKAWSEGWHTQLRKQYELTESEDEMMEKASANTQQNYTEAVRISTLLKRAKPKWDAQKDDGVPNFMARFKWEYPWEITFHRVPKDSPARKAWKDLPTVGELMEAMETPQPAEMETDANINEEATQWTKEASTAKKREASQEAEDAAQKKTKQDWYPPHTQAAASGKGTASFGRSRSSQE